MMDINTVINRIKNRLIIRNLWMIVEFDYCKIDDNMLSIQFYYNHKPIDAEFNICVDGIKISLYENEIELVISNTIDEIIYSMIESVETYIA